MPIGTESRHQSLGFTWRVFALTALLVGMVVAVALVVASDSVRRASDRTAQRGLEQSADLVAQVLAGRERSLAGGARVFVQRPYLRALVSERRRADILDQTFEAAAQLESQWVFVTDSRGILLGKSDEPGAFGEDMGNVPLIAGALSGHVTAGFGVSRDSLLFQAVAVPIEIPGGASIGVLVATRLVDSLLAHDVKVATASELVFFTRDQRGVVQLAASTIGSAKELRTAVRSFSVSGPNAQPEPKMPDIHLGGTDYLAQRTSLTTAGGDVVGGFVVLRSRDAERASLADVRRSIAVAGLVGFALALLVAYLAARRVTAPVRTLANAVRRAADGNYDLGIRREVSGSAAGAEVDELADAVDALLADLRDKEALIAMTGRIGSASEPQREDAEARSRSTGSRRRVAGSIASIGAALPGAGARGGIVLAVGEVLANRYRIDALLGSGGMGMVYRALDQSLGEVVAVKVLRPEILAADPAAAEHVKAELRLARRITHRNVVRTHDIGESDGVPFFTMEYVDGTSLADVIHARRSLPSVAVIAVANQLLRALVAAHAQQVIHGDLKPQNLLIGSNGVVKVTDFGVARLMRDPRHTSDRELPDSATAGRLGGATVGTPEYMAPEQLIGGPASVQTDIYAAGIVLHECLYGGTPYHAQTPIAFLSDKLRSPATARERIGAARAVNARTAASGLEELILRMTAPDVAQREASASTLLRAFAALE